MKKSSDVFLGIIVYIDDMMLTGPNENHIVDFKDELNLTFEMSNLGLLHHYLGIEFLHYENGGNALLLQTKYKETLLRRFGLEGCKLVATPMDTSLHLSIHDTLMAYFISRLLSMYAFQGRTFSMRFHRCA